jgi:hypothetical protein
MFNTYMCCSNILIRNKTKSSEKTFLPPYLLYDTDRIENDAANKSFIVACAYGAIITLLPSHCLATIGGIHRLMEGFMKYTAQINSGAMVYIPSFIKTGSGIYRIHRLADSLGIT